MAIFNFHVINKTIYQYKSFHINNQFITFITIKPVDYIKINLLSFGYKLNL